MSCIICVRRSGASDDLYDVLGKTILTWQCMNRYCEISLIRDACCSTDSHWLTCESHSIYFVQLGAVISTILIYTNDEQLADYIGSITLILLKRMLFFRSYKDRYEAVLETVIILQRRVLEMRIFLDSNLYLLWEALCENPRQSPLSKRIRLHIVIPYENWYFLYVGWKWYRWRSHFLWHSPSAHTPKPTAMYVAATRRRAP